MFKDTNQKEGFELFIDDFSFTFVRKMKHWAWILIFLIFQLNFFPQSDSLKLPFAIADEKRLSEEDLAHKREGFSITGVPQLSSDPVNGFGYGAEGMLYYNGHKSDPFFNYTPYRRKLSLALFNTTRMQNEAVLGLDMPYIFNSKWRVRMEGIFENDPNMLYFGISQSSLNPLVNPQSGLGYNNYENYLGSLTGNYSKYNRFIEKNNVSLGLSAEHSFFHSKMRTLLGFGFSSIGIATFPGNALLVQESQEGIAKGLGRWTVCIFQSGLIYDTRDLESDPGKGIFAEVTNEISNNVFGSQFNFDKVFFQVKWYQKLLPSLFKKMVFAARAGISTTLGDAPFYEYQEVWSSEGGIYGIAGGANTLRGYKQSRFVAPYIGFANAELRTRFAQFRISKEHISLSGVPFFDIAGVGDNPSQLLGNINNYRYAYGAGLRIAWNVNTILRFDYAISTEDHQFFFSFGHAF